MQFDHWFAALDGLLKIKSGQRDCPIPIFDCEGRLIGRHEHLCQRHLDDDALVERFVRWRNQNRSGYLDQRPTTFEATRKWLIDVVTNPTRQASLMYAGDVLVGRSGTVDIRPQEVMSDGLVRGERGGGIRFMHYAQVAGIIWTFRFLGISAILSKVLSSNDAALESCRLLGYDMQPYQVRPVYRKEGPEGIYLEEHGGPEEQLPGVQLAYYRLRREAFFQFVGECRGFVALDQAIQANCLFT